jgi:hypothetical protein
MSDYLGELASRAVGAAPLVQPRLASRFEPRHPELLGESAEGDDQMTAARPAPQLEPGIAEPVDAPGSGDGRRRHLEADAASPAAPASPRRSPPVEVPAEPPSAPSPTTGAAGPSAMARGAEQRRAGRPDALPRERRTEPKEIPAGAERTALLPARVGEDGRAGQSVGRGHGRPSPALAGPPADAGGARRAVPATAARGGAGERSTGAAGQSEPTAGTASSQPRSTRRDGARFESDRPTPNGQEPIVQVTIGRVEVRAVTPPRPTPTKRAAARSGPAVSLGEYLKQRNEGR